MGIFDLFRTKEDKREEELRELIQDESSMIWAFVRASETDSRKLVEMGANINAINAFGETVLTLAIKNKDRDKVALFLELGADIEMRDNEDRTPLMRALSTSNAEIVKLLLDNNADIEAVSTQNSHSIYNNASILMYALKGVDREDAIEERKATIEVLLERGIDINAGNTREDSPLMLAILSKNKELVKFVLEKGADIDAQNIYGETALFSAIYQEDTELVKLLLEYPIDLEMTNTHNETAIMNAVYLELPEIVELLAKKGADLEGTLDLAESKGFREVAKILERYGAETESSMSPC